MNFSYTPTSQVLQAHNIPHLTSDLKPAGGNSPSFSLDKTYYQSLLPFPAIIITISLVIVLLDAILVLWRKWQMGMYNTMLTLSERCNSRLRFVHIVGFFLFCLFFTNFFIFFDSQASNAAIADALYSFDSITNLFASISNAAGTIAASSDNILALSKTTTCQQLNSAEYLYTIIQDELAVLTKNSVTIREYAAPIDDDIGVYISLIEQMMQSKAYVVGVFVTTVFVLVVSFTMSMYYYIDWLYCANNVSAGSSSRLS